MVASGRGSMLALVASEVGQRGDSMLALVSPEDGDMPQRIVLAQRSCIGLRTVDTSEVQIGTLEYNLQRSLAGGLGCPRPVREDIGDEQGGQPAAAHGDRDDSDTESWWSESSSDP